VAILDGFTDQQKKALAMYESLSGFEPMHQEEFLAGKMSFDELWHSNQHWFEGLQNEVSHISAPIGDVDDEGFQIVHFVDRAERV